MLAESSQLHKPQDNLLLRALSSGAQERLFPDLELVEMAFGQVLNQSGETLRSVYFPTDSTLSLQNLLEGGACTEICVVGREGLIGLPPFMGGQRVPSLVTVQSAGFSYRLEAKRLIEQCSRRSELLLVLLRYAQSLITQISQTAACNRHHTIYEQLCQVLLRSLDRSSDNKLKMTHELIANMLGVRREGVTEAAGRLQNLGVIKYSRGRIAVLDRPKLEELSCECYAVVKSETHCLLPDVLRESPI